MIDWRKTHRWLRGYSDARAGRDPLDEPGAYWRGYVAGAVKP
jgi:hypothetical protein